MSNHSGQRTHGGYRAGAGRKPAHGETTVRRTIQLTPAEWAQLDRIHPTASQAVRKLLTFPTSQIKIVRRSRSDVKQNAMRR